MTVRGRGSKPKKCSSVPGLEVCVTYGLENLGCPRPSCVQICERSSKTFGAFRDLFVVSLTTLAVASGATLGEEGEGEAWPELDCLSKQRELGWGEKQELCWAPN